MRLLLLLIIFLIACSRKREHKLIKTVHLNYPSASGIEYLNKQVYLAGDDAAYMLVLDTQLAIKDSFPIFNYGSGRIPKEVKSDIESLAAIKFENRNYLFAAGSGSNSPYRDIALLIDPFRHTVDSVRLDSLFFRFKEAGIKDLNIEGSCYMYGTMALVSRGNKSFPRNFLALLPNAFWKKQTTASFNLIRVGGNNDTAVFNGISGLAYSQKYDQLIMTVSTENTYSSYADGSIGKSYIWIIKNISAKREWSAINPDVVIDLEEIDDSFKGEKIESVCILTEQKKEMELLLCADNDNGSSTVFKLNVIKD